MESKQALPELELRYFSLPEDYVYAQFSAKMSDEEFTKLTGQKQNEDSIFKTSNGKAMFLCLDESGSMAGKPYEALQKGALFVGKPIYESNEFGHFVTILYDSSAKEHSCPNYEQY